ncbi:MAG: hypothetical protein JXA90_03380, partial [Planctomycetes bacterium]|nr:hypothetical protein [Planctomycetota bacterium]
GQPVDQRSDIYSLGTTFYHLITGRPPFAGKTQIAAIVAHVQEAPQAPHRLREKLPPAVTSVIGRMMAIEPEDRYQSYDELIDDLDCLLEDRCPIHADARRGRFGPSEAAPPLRPRRRWPWALAAAGLGAALLAVWAASQLQPRAPPEAVARLESWYVARGGGGDVLDLDFTQPPSGVADILAEALIVPPAAGAGVAAPHIAGGGLHWENYAPHFACRFEFERIDEISVCVGAHRGLFDLGIYVVHPDGNIRRELRLCLRPSEEDDRFLGARRNNEEVEIVPAPVRMPRLPPPYDVFVSFSAEAGSTLVHFWVSKKSDERKAESRILFEQRRQIAGRDWNSGILVLRTLSSGRPFSVHLERIVISGVLSGQRVEEVPWHG